jgi:uncharacterized protein (TIGR02246 family)
MCVAHSSVNGPLVACHKWPVAVIFVCVPQAVYDWEGERIMSEDVQEASRSIVSQLEQAWNNADGEAFGVPFTDDARFVDIRGEYHRGKNAIAEGHQAIFDSIYKGSMLSYELFDLNPLSDTTAVANVRAVLRVPAGPLAGEQRSVSTLFLVLNDETWRVASFHNTLVKPL